MNSLSSKVLLKRVSLISLFTIFSIVTFAQRNWQFGFYYPLLEQFDVNPKIQANLSPSIFNINRADVLSDDLNTLDTIWRAPFAFGLVLTKKLDKSWISLDYLSKYAANLLGPYYTLKSGSMRGTRFHRISLNVSKPVKIFNHGCLFSYYGTDFRWGVEYYGKDFIPGSHHYPARHLYDFGLSGGLSYQWFPFSHVGFNLNTGLRQWLFLYAHTVDKVSVKGPRSEFEIKLGMSYLFGEKVDLIPLKKN